MIDGLESLHESSEQAGVDELRELLSQLLGGPEAKGRLESVDRLQSRQGGVCRLRFDGAVKMQSVIVKRMNPVVAQRNELVAKRWLPALGLGQCDATLLGAAAERHGQCVWHVYEDLGDAALDPTQPDPSRVKAAVELIAQVHTRFANHPLLAECRLSCADLGIYFFTSNVRDAIHSLEALRPPRVELSAEHHALRDRLLGRLRQLLGEQPTRARALADLGGPETLLHGDLWTTNTFVLTVGSGLQARLIDWDHAGVGPVSYDLSTFLLRFPPGQRLWILQWYRDVMASAGWRLPTVRDLNLLFETAEYARFANRVIWPAIGLVMERSAWAFDELAEVERWFEDWRPILPMNHLSKPNGEKG
jgi:hypothetical protein